MIVDTNGIPISVLLAKGSDHDGTLFFDNIEDMLIHIDRDRNKKNNKHIRYMMGDKIYDTNKIRDTIKNKNMIPIIGYNKRCTKDEKK